MTNYNNFTKTFASVLTLTLAIYPQAWAEVTVPSINTILQNLGLRENRINNDDSTWVSAPSAHAYGSVAMEYLFYHYASDNTEMANTGWARTNLTINGDTYPGTTKYGYYQTLDIDSQGRVIGFYKDSYWNDGGLIEKYKYADDGQMLVYNPQGELIGAYNSWFQRRVVSLNYTNKPESLNHLTDGNYVVKDENDNVLGEYYANGDYLKNTYNEKGDLISSNKYNKDGNVLASSTNKYDSGGNLIASYKNGVATFRRTSYTPAEAAAAVKKGNNNKITLTFK